MANPLDYALTNHAIERLHERCESFAKQIDSITIPALKRKVTYEFLSEASEEKSFLNNSVFMTMLGEKYGFENQYTMFVRDNSVFVGVSNNRGRFIVTVLKRDEHYLNHIKHRTKKFEKKPKEKISAYFPPGRRR